MDTSLKRGKKKRQKAAGPSVNVTNVRCQSTAWQDRNTRHSLACSAGRIWPETASINLIPSSVSPVSSAALNSNNLNFACLFFSGWSQFHFIWFQILYRSMLKPNYLRRWRRKHFLFASMRIVHIRQLKTMECGYFRRNYSLQMRILDEEFHKPHNYFSCNFVIAETWRCCWNRL